MLAGKSLAYHDESYTMKKNYDRNHIHLIRLTHRIKCRLYNWTLRELLLSWKWYLLETIDEVRNRTITILLTAFLKNLFSLPGTLEERRNRSLSRAIEFEYPYKEVATFL